MYDTNGAQGAALGGRGGAGIYKSFKEAFSGANDDKFVRAQPRKGKRVMERLLSAGRKCLALALSLHLIVVGRSNPITEPPITDH